MKNKKLIAGIGCGVLVAALVIGLAVGGNKNGGSTTADTDKNIESSAEGNTTESSSDVTYNPSKEDLIEEKNKKYDEMLKDKNATLLTEDKAKEYISEITNSKNVNFTKIISAGRYDIDTSKLTNEICKDTSSMEFQSLLSNYEWESSDYVGIQYSLNTGYYSVDDVNKYAEYIKMEEKDPNFDYSADLKTEFLVDSIKEYGDIYSITEAIAQEFGIDTTSIICAYQDDDYYQRFNKDYSQNLYHCKITDKFDLKNIGIEHYDILLNIDTAVHMSDDVQNNRMDAFYIYVEYIEGGKYYDVVLEFSINCLSDEFYTNYDIESMGPCDCAPTSGCNTGTNDPCEPECEMEDPIR